MIYRKIETLREQNNFTKLGVAKAIGKSRQWYADILKFKNIRLDDLIALAELFKVPVTYLFEADNNIYVNESAGKYGKPMESVLEILKDQLNEKDEQLKKQDGQIRFLQSLIKRQDNEQ